MKHSRNQKRPKHLLKKPTPDSRDNESQTSPITCVAGDVFYSSLRCCLGDLIDAFRRPGRLGPELRFQIPRQIIKNA